MMINNLRMAIFMAIWYLMPSDIIAQTASQKKDLTQIKASSGVKKLINSFDYDCDNFLLSNTGPKNQVKLSIDPATKHLGSASLKCAYSFVGSGANQAAEVINLRKIWGNYRSDLSFHPLGVSVWVKGSSDAKDKLTIKLLQQNEAFSLPNESLNVFAFSDPTVLNQDKWQQIVIPYSWFKSEKGAESINLKRVVGYEFSIENSSRTAHSASVNFDSFEQLTSFRPVIKQKSKFSSIFVQLSVKAHARLDWISAMKAYKEVGIDTIIIQHALRNPETGTFTHYLGSNLAPVDKQYPMIDEMFTAAEKTGMKLVLGLNHGKYPDNKGEAAVYDKLFETNKLVIDELYEKFSGNKQFAGWYIAEEYHDGGYKGWWKPEHAYLLSHYQERVAAYAKSKPKKFLVAIAPALWRGKPADMTYTFFKRILEKTPSVDILYLQDCAGRLNIDNDDLIVDLPNYFAMVKKACDESGVKFGVDIESFTKGHCKKKYGTKTWPELKLLLDIAGMYTENITQFSWASFRPGVGAFDGYKKYVIENKLAKR